MASDRTHVYDLNKSTAYTNATKNSADMDKSSPSHLRMTPSLPKTCHACSMFYLKASQLLSEYSSVCPRYLNTATPSVVSSHSFPFKLNSISVHQFLIYPSLLVIHISVFLKQRAILWFLSRCSVGM